MTKPHFRVLQLDHIELYVPDRYDAARWYENFLGLQILSDYEHWAEGGGGGPLMLSSDDGNTKLALFEGPPQGAHDIVGYKRMAFRVDGAGFMRFLTRLASFPVFDAAGKQATAADAVDHDKAFSIYFCDPYGNRLEITTYDHDFVRASTRR